MSNRTASAAPAVQPVVLRLLGFAAVAGLGLVADVLTYAVLVSCGVAAGWSNAAGALVGITIAYLLSVRHVFGDRRGVQASTMGLWLAWQVVLVTCASALVNWLSYDRGLGPTVAKIIVTPATFLANFAAMSIITRRGRVTQNPS